MTWIDYLSESIRRVPVNADGRDDVDALFAFHRAVSRAVSESAGTREEAPATGGGGAFVRNRGDGVVRAPISGRGAGAGTGIESFLLLRDAFSTGNFDRRLRFPVDPVTARSAFDAAERIGGEGGGALAPMCERAAEVLGRRIPGDESELRAFLDDWSGQTALLVARAMGVRGAWQRAGVLSAARAHTLSKHLCRIDRDLAAGLVLFPMSDLDRFGVRPEEIAGGSVDGADRLVWKQVIRIQEALSGVVDLVADLDNRPARRIRRWWFTVIELTHALETLEFDVGSLPTGPSRMQRAQITFQSLFGRTTFRG